MSQISFALIGAAGYVAPRHMRAIKAVGGDLKVAFDPNDFGRHHRQPFSRRAVFHRIRAVRPTHRQDAPPRREIDYVVDLLAELSARRPLSASPCAPDADAICEKPLVLNPWNIDGLAEIEQETGRKVSTILQLRLHPAILALKEKMAASE